MTNIMNSTSILDRDTKIDCNGERCMLPIDPTHEVSETALLHPEFYDQCFKRENKKKRKWNEHAGNILFDGKPLPSSAYYSIFMRKKLKYETESIGKSTVKEFEQKFLLECRRNGTSVEESTEIIKDLPLKPWKVLDGPGLRDDFYLNTLSWSDSNTLAVALDNIVYVWRPETGPRKLMELGSSYVSSVRWAGNGKEEIAIGSSSGFVYLYDAGSGKKVREFKQHYGRVAALAWNHSMLSSGGMDSKIVHNDVRKNGQKLAAMQSAHRGCEVVSLEWAPDERFLASGGDDDAVNIYRSPLSKKKRPTYRLREHSAAIKALTWCPSHPNILATGGGSQDNNICLWNANNGKLLSKTNARAQISGLSWSGKGNSLIASYGYLQRDADPTVRMCQWEVNPANYKLEKHSENNGYHTRIISAAQTPDGSKIITAGANERLSIWDVYPATKLKPVVVKPASQLFLNSIR